MPKIKFTPFLPYETIHKIDKKTELNEQHIRITRSMYYSPSYKALSKNAMFLYGALRFRFYREAEKKQDFEVARDYGTKILGLSEKSGNSTKRALKELVAFGFLDPTLISNGGGKSNKIKNRFMFSTRWKDITEKNVKEIKEKLKQKNDT